MGCTAAHDAAREVPSSVVTAVAPSPYISGEAGARLFDVLPPAPKSGDARDAADRRIFRETRSHEGTPRWAMAQADAELGTAAMLQHFSCSLGIELAPVQVPRLIALLQKGTREAAQSVGRGKDHYQRLRPFKVDEGTICVARGTVGDSYDYPSGHTTAGWAWALLLAQVEPARAPEILARGRAIGDSRVICGVHNASAVEGARLVASAAITMVTASVQYQTDLAAARAELQKVQSGDHRRPEASRCEAESLLVGTYW